MTGSKERHASSIGTLVWRPEQELPGTVNSGCPGSASSQATSRAQFSSALVCSRAKVDLPAPFAPHTAMTGARLLVLASCAAALMPSAA